MTGAWLRLLNEKYVADAAQGFEIISLLVQIHGCSDSQLVFVHSSRLNTIASNLGGPQFSSNNDYREKVKIKNLFRFIQV